MALNFQQRGRSGASTGLLALFLAVSLILVVVYAREGQDGPLHSAQATVSGWVAPVQTAGAPVGAAAEHMQEVVVDATADEGSLSEMRELNRQLIAQYAQSEEDRLEAERLRGLLGRNPPYGAKRPDDPLCRRHPGRPAAPPVLCHGRGPARLHDV